MSEVKKGLMGVVADTTTVSKVMPEINSLVYRGYPVQDLAENCTFEEVAYLLYFGQLPTQNQLDDFITKEKSYRQITPRLKEILQKYPTDAHPMDTLKTSLSVMGMERKADFYPQEDEVIDELIRMMAAIPTLIAATYRTKNGKEMIEPREDLTLSENFFHMCFGKVPHHDVVKAFEVSLILYAEHGFNASTFTSRVITSTLSDVYNAVTGAIGALKGPLHGGANEQVMHMLLEVGEVQKAEQWMLEALKQKKKIMGFGHRVYRSGDSRVPTMKKYADKLGSICGEEKWSQISAVLEETMVKQKNIYPNLDFPAGPAYYLMGFDIDMFTPIFVMSRVAGWGAHIVEQRRENKLIRPLCEYQGPGERHVTPIQSRA